jgi:hypothetical protein
MAACSQPALGQAGGQVHPASLESPVRSILKHEAYPWYDAPNDRVKSMLPDPASWSAWMARQAEAFLDWLGHLFDPQNTSSTGSRSRFSGLLPTLFFIVAGVCLLLSLWRLWRLYEPKQAKVDDRAAIGEAARIAGLMPSTSLEGVDPWAEAVRHRASGNWAAAVIWLFLDQLLALERSGRIRLSSGRTARAYVSMIDDPQLALGLRSTLGTFEQVYYGHRVPDIASLERVWSQAEAFRRRLESLRSEARG